MGSQSRTAASRGINIEEETWINKMCRSEETLEKLDNAEAMIGRATNLLRELQALGLEPKKDQEQALFRRRVVQVTSELEDVRDLLTGSARAVLSERQLEVLEPHQGEEEEEQEVVVDPSIQFLGLEWEAIFGKCFNLGINIRIYRQRLGAGSVDTLTLALVLRDLQRVVAEVEHHSRAVLAKDQREGLHQTMVQGGSTNQINVQNDRRQGVTYRKTKTEGLASKLENMEPSPNLSSGAGGRRKSSFRSRKGRRKSSLIMEGLSSMLRPIKL